MNIILADQNYELTELAKAIANSPDDLFYVVKKIDGKDVSFAITREQLLSGISGGGSESKFIISGGAFWTGTGMDFDVSAVEYNYFGSIGITAPTTITLDNGDSDERFDIIVVNADTNSIEVVKGIPGSPAAFPEIAENQITLQPVLVSAGATTPNIINEPIYLNDAEWTATTYGGGTGTINFQSPIDPYEGAFCIEAINPVSLGMNFKYNGGTIDLQDFPFLTFFIKLDAPLTGSKAIYAFVGVGGVKKGLTISLKNSVDNNLVGAWQQVTVATSIFNAHVPIDFLRLVLAGSGPTIKYYMDMIVLSSGIDGGNVQADKITVQDGGASIGTRPKLNFVEGANVSFNIADDPVNDRVNIEISSVGGGGGSGGQVDSVTGIPNEIEVTGTATDPIVGLAQAAKNSLALADSALQPGDEFSGDYNDLTNKPDISVFVKTDGSTPFIAKQVGVPAENPNELVTLSQLPDLPVLECTFPWETVYEATYDPNFNDPSSIALQHLGGGSWIWFLHNSFPSKYRVGITNDNGTSWSFTTLNGGMGVIHHIKAGASSRIITIFSGIPYYSDDLGLTYQECQTPYVDYFFSFTGLSTDQDGVWIATAKNTTTEECHILRSVDNGVSFSFVQVIELHDASLIESDENATFIIALNGIRMSIMRSLNNGVSFTDVAIPETTPGTMRTDRNGVWIIVNTVGGNRILRSDSNGSSWSEHYIPHSASWVYVDIATDYDGTWLVLANADTNRLKISKDHGLTWSEENIPIGVSSKFHHQLGYGDGVWLNSDSFYYVKRGIQSCPQYIISDSRSPFTAPQTGVPGTDPNHLATVSQIPAAPSNDFIPLTGTEVGSPVTGMVEIGDDFIGFTQTSGDFTNILWFQQDAGIGIEVIEEGISNATINFYSKEFLIQSNDPLCKGFTGQRYFGANYGDNTYVQKKYVDDKTKEEAIQGTAIYNGAMTGTVNLDLSTFTDIYGILTGNTTITVSETPATGKSFVRSATIKSTVAESLTLPVGWIVKGAYNADGTENDLEIKFTNYPTVGLKVWCYINGAT